MFAPGIIVQAFPPVEHRVTWTIVYKCRNNSKFVKEEFLSVITPLIPENYMFLSYNADLTIVLDITQHLMCLSVLKDWEKYKKFSFFSFIEKIKNEENSEKEGDSEKGTEKDAISEEETDKHIGEQTNYDKQNDDEPVADDIRLF
jgi:hypothetical protein